MSNDVLLDVSIEFEVKLRELLSQYEFGLCDVIAILESQANRAGVSASKEDEALYRAHALCVPPMQVPGGNDG